MTCQQCTAEATVHLTRKVEGKLREVHLCADCARRAGIPTGAPEQDLGLDAVLQSLIQRHVGELLGTLARTTCPICGLEFMEFRIGGPLGCPQDYLAFVAGLTPLLRRTQPASRHVGKRPRRREPGNERLVLRSRLREAIACEDYEKAARLRDLLRHEDTEA